MTLVERVAARYKESASPKIVLQVLGPLFKGSMKGELTSQIEAFFKDG